MLYYKYCPRCGKVYAIIGRDNKYCECIEKLTFIDKQKEKKNAVLMDTSVPHVDGSANIPKTADGISLYKYEKVWETYVDIPENNKLNKTAFEEHKATMLKFFNKGGFNHRAPLPPPQSQQPKDASVIGRGVAGAIIAGPAGAVIGAASALDKNMKNANKKK